MTHDDSLYHEIEKERLNAIL